MLYFYNKLQFTCSLFSWNYPASVSLTLGYSFVDGECFQVLFLCICVSTSYSGISINAMHCCINHYMQRFRIMLPRSPAFSKKLWYTGIKTSWIQVVITSVWLQMQPWAWYHCFTAREKWTALQPPNQFYYSEKAHPQWFLDSLPSRSLGLQ